MCIELIISLTKFVGLPKYITLFTYTTTRYVYYPLINSPSWSYDALVPLDVSYHPSLPSGNIIPNHLPINLETKTLASKNYPLIDTCIIAYHTYWWQSCYNLYSFIFDTPPIIYVRGACLNHRYTLSTWRLFMKDNCSSRHMFIF